jgi:very-short-patch-repair endonuclease
MRMFTGVFRAGSRSIPRSRSAHQALRNVLHSRRLRRYRFQHAQVIGPFVVDAVCPERALVIQIEREHRTFRGPREDARAQLLEGMGFRVLHVWSQDLLRNPETVAVAITAALG